MVLKITNLKMKTGIWINFVTMFNTNNKYLDKMERIKFKINKEKLYFSYQKSPYLKIKCCQVYKNILKITRYLNFK